MGKNIPLKIGLSDEIEQFVARKKTRSTRGTYKGAYQQFLIYYRKNHGGNATIPDFVEAVFDDLDQPLRERQRIAENELSEYVAFLQSLDPPKSNNTVRTYVAALQSYLSYKGIHIQMKFVNPPRAIEVRENQKHKWTLEQLKKFVDLASTYRDKAIIACLVQSGLGVGDLVDLDYRDIKNDFERGTLPIMLKLTRKKSQVEFMTFFGRDAVRYLRFYLKTRKNLTKDSPLFTKWGQNNKRITIGAVEMKFKDMAKRVDFIDGEDLEEGYNPCRPHSLRSAFNSLLMNKIDEELRHFWMGHSIGKVAETYLNMPDKEMRELYMTAEKFLAFEKTSRSEIAELEQKKMELSAEVEMKIKGLEGTVSALQRKIGEQGVTIDGLSTKFEKQVTALKTEFDQKLAEFFDEYGSRYSDEVPEEIKNETVSKEEILRAKRRLGKDRRSRKTPKNS